METNIKEIISNIPKQFSQALIEVDVKISKTTKNIVFCGLGGSALPADLLKTYLNASGFKTPAIKINRDYKLPTGADKSWCGFFDSYSGNTAETLSCLKQAQKMGMKQIILIAHDGQLTKIDAKQHYPMIKIPNTDQPRLSYAFVLGALLKVMHNSGFIKLNLKALNKEIEKCLALSNEMEQQGKQLAQKINGCVPIIYSLNEWASIARTWKINFNENAKIPAFYNIFPELCHNELVGWTNQSNNHKIIILKDLKSDKRTQKAMEIFKDIVDGKISVEIIDMKDGSPLFKMMTTLWLGLWTSYHLALLNGVEPAEVKLVNEFKKKMSNI